MTEAYPENLKDHFIDTETTLSSWKTWTDKDGYKTGPTKKYAADIGEVTDAKLFIEDHGMLMVQVDFKFPHSGQSFQMLPQSIDMLAKFMKAFHLQSMVGNHYYALRDTEFPDSGFIRGIVSLDRKQFFSVLDFDEED